MRGDLVGDVFQSDMAGVQELHRRHASLLQERADIGSAQMVIETLEALGDAGIQEQVIEVAHGGCLESMD